MSKLIKQELVADAKGTALSIRKRAKKIRVIHGILEYFGLGKKWK